MTNFRLFHIERLCRRQFEIRRKWQKVIQTVFKPVENTAGKRKIARYEQFLLFPQCFLKACFPGASKGVIVWEWVKQHTINLFPRICVHATNLLRKHVSKQRNLLVPCSKILGHLHLQTTRLMLLDG